MTTKTPPIKSQGIKTKLVPFIRDSIVWSDKIRWVEPFMGSGVVALNMQPKKALLADANPHLIGVYRDIQSGALNPASIREHLQTHGDILNKNGEEYYYEVRKRFNETPSSFDFLFLNRSCFNGVIRFNRKGHFNVPFCKKTERFRPAYITKIANQVAWVQKCLTTGDYDFVVQDWRKTLADTSECDFVYIDPPYIARHTDYYNSWADNDDHELADTVRSLPCGFAFSTWLQNKYRKNEYIEKHFADFPMKTRSHFYHVGSHESLRNEMIEALIIQNGYAKDSSSEDLRQHDLQAALPL